MLSFPVPHFRVKAVPWHRDIAPPRGDNDAVTAEWFILVHVGQLGHVDGSSCTTKSSEPEEFKGTVVLGCALGGKKQNRAKMTNGEGHLKHTVDPFLAAVNLRTQFLRGLVKVCGCRVGV